MPAGFVGVNQLRVTAGNGQTTVNGLTFHVIGGSYNPAVFEVGPGRTYAPADTLPVTADHAIQRALDAAATFVSASSGNSSRGALVVVYPNNPAGARSNPRGAYYENLIISSKVKLQGVGPGSPDGSVRGSIIDGGAFGGDSPVATDWYTRIGTLTWAGNQTIYDGAVISIYVPNDTDAFTTAERRRAFPTTYNPTTAPSIDGFDLRGGDQQGFPGNINEIGGGPDRPARRPDHPGRRDLRQRLRPQPADHEQRDPEQRRRVRDDPHRHAGPAGARHRQPERRRPHRQQPDHRQRRHQPGGRHRPLRRQRRLRGRRQRHLRQLLGRVRRRREPSTAYSPNGTIHHNRIYFNQSYDEGGGIMIAGQLPADPRDRSRRARARSTSTTT